MEDENSKENKALAPRKRGRPPGAKNKDTIFKELMKEDFQALATTEVQKVFHVLFQKAQEGDLQAIKLVLDRVVPTTKAVDLAEIKDNNKEIHIHIGSLESAVTVKEEEVIDAEFSEVE